MDLNSVVVCPWPVNCDLNLGTLSRVRCAGWCVSVGRCHHGSQIYQVVHGRLVDKGSRSTIGTVSLRACILVSFYIPSYIPCNIENNTTCPER